MSIRRATTAVIALLLVSTAGSAAETESQRLASLVDRYYEEFLPLHPTSATFLGDHRYDDRLAPAGEALRRATQQLEPRYAEAIRRIDRNALTGDDIVTWDTFEFGRRIVQEGLAFPTELTIVQQIENPAMLFVQMGSGESIQPFTTVTEYERFAGRMTAFPGWVDATIVAMREGTARGIVQPRIVMERVQSQLALQLAKTPEESVFWQPVKNMPASFAPTDRERLTARYRTLIAQSVLPSYRKLHDFVRDEYLPKARASVGLSALPDGARWYDWLARAYTTTDTPVADIHRIGLSEVARIDAEIARVAERIDFKGTTSELGDSMRHDERFKFREPAALVNAYRAMQARVDAAVPRLFSVTPKSPLVIREMEAFRAPTEASAEYYAPSADGRRPGTFYVNTYKLPERPSYEIEHTYAHEAVPGHHFQVALSIENPTLPRFRRYGAGDVFFAAMPETLTAFEEGWGLYAETLGDELGLYTDPYQKLGALFAESWRACRLVVDTGMHAQGWTRERAIDYMLAHTANSRTDVTAEVERYIAWPGQALAYKTGQMKIRELRTRAERELGPRFDVRDFHAQVLGSGALPLGVLEAKIDRWIRETK